MKIYLNVRKYIILTMERDLQYEQAEKESYGMQIVNGNGMSWTIEGGAHWTKDDYMEELRNYNQALRVF